MVYFSFQDLMSFSFQDLMSFGIFIVALLTFIFQNKK